MCFPFTYQSRPHASVPTSTRWPPGHAQLFLCILSVHPQKDPEAHAAGGGILLLTTRNTDHLKSCCELGSGVASWGSSLGSGIQACRGGGPTSR